MENEVNEYVRLEYGRIDKVKNNDYYMQQYIECEEGLYPRENIVKHSKNIIDLVELGDYVNGYKVISIDYDVIDDKTECIELDLNNNYQYNFISARQIKSIVTHEQMASIEYKVEKEG